jgi:hypothetical protein
MTVEHTAIVLRARRGTFVRPETSPVIAMRPAPTIVLCALGSALAVRAQPVLSQPLAPKVCVAVARDPDPAVRAIAARVEALLEASLDARTVSDPIARATLRGEPASDGMETVSGIRRALDFTDADATPLTRLAESLGCARVIELSSTPRGVAMRAFAVLTQTFDRAEESSTWTDAEIAPRVGIGRASGNSVTMTRRDASPTVRRDGAASRASASTPDPRVTLDRTDSSPTPTARRAPVWAFVIAGVAGAALVGGFIAAQSLGPSIPIVHVSGPGALR